MKAFMFIKQHTKNSKSISTGAATVTGAARVKLLRQLEDGYVVEVEKVSGPYAALVGTTLPVPREELYVHQVELDHFEKCVNFYWGAGDKPGDRPAVHKEELDDVG